MCVFCKIGQGEIGAEIIYQDDLVVAFLDICPIRAGHTQVIPVEHFACFEELPTPVASRIMRVGQNIAKALKQLYAVERVAFLFTGGDVAHAHAHVVPMHDKTDITSRRYILEEMLTFQSVPTASPAELEATATALRARLKTVIGAV